MHRRGEHRPNDLSTRYQESHSIQIIHFHSHLPESHVSLDDEKNKISEQFQVTKPHRQDLASCLVCHFNGKGGSRRSLNLVEAKQITTRVFSPSPPIPIESTLMEVGVMKPSLAAKSCLERADTWLQLWLT